MEKWGRVFTFDIWQLTTPYLKLFPMKNGPKAQGQPPSLITPKAFASERRAKEGGGQQSENRRQHPTLNVEHATPNDEGREQAPTLKLLRAGEDGEQRIYSKGKPDSLARSCKLTCRLFPPDACCLRTFISALVKYRA